jgi:hypothetical protein
MLTQVSTHTCIHTYIHACIHTQVFTHTCIHTYVSIRMRISAGCPALQPQEARSAMICTAAIFLNETKLN